MSLWNYDELIVVNLVCHSNWWDFPLQKKIEGANWNTECILHENEKTPASWLAIGIRKRDRPWGPLSNVIYFIQTFAVSNSSFTDSFPYRAFLTPLKENIENSERQSRDNNFFGYKLYSRMFHKKKGTQKVDPKLSCTPKQFPPPTPMTTQKQTRPNSHVASGGPLSAWVQLPSP